jgi:hypothetical protein
MANYLVMWETVPGKWPVDPKERAELTTTTRKMVSQDIKDGITTSWGQFIGGGKGYSVLHGNGPDLFKWLRRYNPYFTFNVQEILSLDEVEKASKG